MKKYIVLGLVLSALIITPALANTPPPTVADLLAIIERLRAQIVELQRQQRFVIDPIYPTDRPCYNFNQNLKFGDRGDQVYWLYKILYKHRTSNDANDYLNEYNEMLASWVTEFQEQNAGEVLRPNGLARGTGYVGPSTRAVLNRLYGCRTVIGNQPPIISDISGPTSLRVGETGTWIIMATDPEKGPLSYSVIWGDNTPLPMSAGESGLPAIQAYIQTATLTHSFAQAGVYYPTVFVRDQAGKIASKMLTVRVGNVITPSITVLSPNGGENWVSRAIHPVTWRMTGATADTKVDLYLDANYCPPDAYCALYYRDPYVLDRNIAWNATYNWIVATDIVDRAIPAGNYRVKICLAGSLENCDMSDASFAITSSVNTNLPPTISGISGPTTLRVGQTGTWTINASDPEGGPLSYDLTWGDAVYALDAAGLPIGREQNFVQTAGFTHRYNADGNYTVTAVVRDSAGNFAKATMTANVTGPITY